MARPKMHPSIVISTRGEVASVYVKGACKLFRKTEAEAYEYASTVSDTLWEIEVGQPKHITLDQHYLRYCELY